MKKYFFTGCASWLFTLFVFITLAGAGVNIQVTIAAPPPVVFESSPEMVVLPGTNIYVVPDYDEDLYFVDGWWWRPWNGHWYRSHNYRGKWSYYRYTPSFYGQITPGWRDEYRGHHWRDHEWNYQRVPSNQVQHNWRTWKNQRYWEKQENMERQRQDQRNMERQNRDRPDQERRHEDQKNQDKSNHHEKDDDRGR
jgi:hypothetical protein